MYREKKRERRIRDRKRMKAKARKVVARSTLVLPGEDAALTVAGRAGRLADNLAVCSCWMCGNPRRWFGHVTMAERVFDEDGELED